MAMHPPHGYWGPNSGKKTLKAIKVILLSTGVNAPPEKN